MLTRVILVSALLVAFGLFALTIVSAQNSTVTTSGSGIGESPSTVTSISNNSTITVGLMVLIVGLALAVGRNWQQVTSHMHDDGIHHSDGTLLKTFMTTVRHEEECQRVQVDTAQLQAAVQHVGETCRLLNLFLVRKFPDDVIG